MYEYELSWILCLAYVWVGSGLCTMDLIVFTHYSSLTLSLARRDYFGLQ